MRSEESEQSGVESRRLLLARGEGTELLEFLEQGTCCTRPFDWDCNLNDGYLVHEDAHSSLLYSDLHTERTVINK